MFASVQERFKKNWKYERASGLWVFKSILEVYASNIVKVLRENDFYRCWIFNTKMSENDVWFESWAKSMILVKWKSYLNQDLKHMRNSFVWFKSQYMWFESHDSSHEACDPNQMK